MVDAYRLQWVLYKIDIYEFKKHVSIRINPEGTSICVSWKDVLVDFGDPCEAVSQPRRGVTSTNLVLDRE